MACDTILPPTRIYPRKGAAPEPGAPEAPPLAPDTLEAARALAPGADVYALEADWRGWWAETGRPRLGDADKAFLGWVKARRG